MGKVAGLRQQPTFGLAIWRRDEHILNFLFAVQLQYQPTNNAGQWNKQ